MNSEAMDTSAFTDPKRFGPGAWMVLHMFAARADTEERKRNFEYFVRGLAQDFKCLHCREHFQAFIDKHPLSSYYNMKDSSGNDIGMFAWTHELHNNANRFLGKSQCKLDDAYAYYSSKDIGVCTHCGVAESGTQQSGVPAAESGQKRVKFPPAPSSFVSIPHFSPALAPGATIRPLSTGPMPWAEPHPKEEELVQIVKSEKSRGREAEKERKSRFSSR